MNKNKLWIAWAVMALLAMVFFLTRNNDLAGPTMAGAAVLGWMAYASKG